MESSTPLRGLQVLFVDDHADTREGMARLLGSLGATVRTAGGAKEALELLERTPGIDVIVSDIMMALGDGFELIREVRARGHLRAIPAIALTAMVEPDDRRRILAAGYQVHLPKPTGLEHVLDAIRHVVTRVRERNR